MARSVQLQLDDCDARIEVIETSGVQEYSVEALAKKDALLGTYYQERARLEAKVESSRNGGQMASLGQIGRPI